MTYNVLMGTLNPTHSPTKGHWAHKRKSTTGIRSGL